MTAANRFLPSSGIASSNDATNLPKPVHRVARKDSVTGHDSPATAQCKSPQKPASLIPLVYRVWHLWLEPLTALSGVYYLHWAPEQYFEYMPQTARYAAESQIVYNQLAASYLFFAVIEGLVLRTTHDLNVWRAIVFALLLCDAGHLYAAWLEMGTQAFVYAWAWRRHDAATMMSFVVPFVLRIAFLLDIGFEREIPEETT